MTKISIFLCVLFESHTSLQMFIPNPCVRYSIVFLPGFFFYCQQPIFLTASEMQQPGYKCVLAPKLTPSSRFLDCCHHNLTGGSLSTGFYNCCDSSRSTQSHKITIMRLPPDSAAPSGGICWGRESPYSSGYMCALCTLHPSVILKWTPRVVPPSSGIISPSRSVVVWGACPRIKSLMLSYSCCWKCLRNVGSSRFRYSCSPTWMTFTVNCPSFARFRCLRWTRTRKMMSSRWRAEVRTVGSFFALLGHLWRVLVSVAVNHVVMVTT